MNQTIHFIKMHGVGNDYIFVDTSQYPIEHPEAAAIAWSRYHFGIGSDGLVLIGKSPTPDADFTMRIFNADGSEGLMCGNASRCIGKLVYERGMTDKRQIRLMTASGIKTLDLKVGDDNTVESVTVDMLAPALEDQRLFLTDGEALPDGVLSRWATRIMSSLWMISKPWMWLTRAHSLSTIRDSPSAATSILPKSGRTVSACACGNAAAASPWLAAQAPAPPPWLRLSPGAAVVNHTSSWTAAPSTSTGARPTATFT